VGTGNPCSGHNVGPLCNDSCSESLDNCTANDTDGTSCGQVQICSMGSCVSGCGTDLFPPGGFCPIGCDSCDLVNHICFLDCNTANECQSMTLGCATGWACQVNCTGTAACEGATISCPSLYACDVACSANDACKDLVVNCPTEGTCNLSCPTGNANTCNGAVLGCTASLNECVATCAVGGPVTANCSATPTCACSGCP
jgi:hypothetical protein